MYTRSSFFSAMFLEGEYCSFLDQLDRQVMVTILNQEGVVLFANKLYLETTLHSGDEVVGKVMYQFVAKNDVWCGVLPCEAKDGSVFDVCTLIIPLLGKRDVRLKYVLLQMRTEQAIMVRGPNEFVSVVSHQIRTPLSAIKWHTEFLLHEHAGALNAAQRVHVNEIAQSNQRMIDLVDALLAVAHIELGNIVLSPQRISLCEIADAVLQECAPMIREGISIRKFYDPGVSLVLMDPMATRMIFQNLLSNAFKYTETGRVSVGIYRQHDRMCIEIRDTGLGIPSHQQKQIFEKFFRADNVRAHGDAGNGLGLYVVKIFVERMGGHIAFTSQEGAGTVFFVSFPLAYVIPFPDWDDES